MKKLTILLLLALLSVNSAWADVEINETNFPDENFRSWVLSQSYGSDGVLSQVEIAGITSIYVRSLSIKNLQGIEFFTALTDLFCSDNQLTSLDVSKNTMLKYIECYNNQLTSLDVSKNTMLTRLRCGDNPLSSLDISKNTDMEYLWCYNNQLTSLDVSKNSALTFLNCSGNKLTALDLSGCTELNYLFCYNNQLTSLDLSKSRITILECYLNRIKGEGMDALIESLPLGGSRMYVIYNENEGNVMTTTQVATAKSKRWMPYYYDGSDWQEYAGSEPVGLRGDLNGDGEVNMSDVMFLVQKILNGKFPDE